jgi:hypothetical protein
MDGEGRLPQKDMLVGRVKVEALHPSSSDGFRMTGAGKGAGREEGGGASATCPAESERGYTPRTGETIWLKWEKTCS